MTTAKIVLSLYDGARRPLDPSVQVLVTLRDGYQHQLHRQHHAGPTIDFDVPFYNNYGDDYAVLASASKHTQAGTHPVHVSEQVPQPVRLMLLPKKATFNFGDATWAKLRNNHAAVHGLLAHGVSDAEGKERYEKFMNDMPGSLAAFFNITTAMRDIHLPDKTALDYFVEMIWDPKLMQQDRFYAYADERLVDQVVLAAEQGKFAP